MDTSVRKGMLWTDKLMPLTLGVEGAGRVVEGKSCQEKRKDCGGLRRRVAVIYAGLGISTLAIWLCALVAFYGHMALLGMAALIYGLGLRHAVDADHIAAIDNVTRKLVQDGQQPVLVGFFFALGHSAVVVLVVAAVAGVASMLGGINAFQATGGLISTGVSALFLLGIAALNLAVFGSLCRTYQRAQAGHICSEAQLDKLLNGRGLLPRLLRPLLLLVGRSWHVLPLGFAFGLGFDTATEVAVFGLSAEQATKGLSAVTVLVFPLLFAAAMTLADTTDGIVMLHLYRWAFVNPMRKLRYNMVITLMSIMSACCIGGLEALSLAANQFHLGGSFWSLVRNANGNFNLFGLVLIAAFASSWALSFLLFRTKRLDENVGVENFLVRTEARS